MLAPIDGTVIIESKDCGECSCDACFKNAHNETPENVELKKSCPYAGESCHMCDGEQAVAYCGLCQEE